MSEEILEGPEEKINPWLAGGIIFSLLLIFILVAVIIQRSVAPAPAARTALERDIIKYENLIRKNPNNVQNYIGLAEIYSETGQSSLAIKELRKALSIKPKSWNANFQLGLVYLSKGSEKKAIKAFEQAIKVSPLNELPYYQIGLAYLSTKNYRRAIPYLKKTVELNPVLADAHYYLGFSWEKTGQKELATKEYQEALKYIPDYPKAKEGLKRLIP